MKLQEQLQKISDEIHSKSFAHCAHAQLEMLYADMNIAGLAATYKTELKNIKMMFQITGELEGEHIEWVAVGDLYANTKEQLLEKTEKIVRARNEYTEMIEMLKTMLMEHNRKSCIITPDIINIVASAKQLNVTQEKVTVQARRNSDTPKPSDIPNQARIGGEVEEVDERG